MESTSLRVTIVPLLDMTVSKTRLRRGRQLAISGILWSRANEAKVDVLIERKVRGRYTKVRRRRAKVTDHRYLRVPAARHARPLPDHRVRAGRAGSAATCA